MRGAVRYLTDRVGGVVLSPDDAIGDGQTVRDALLEKHPEGGIPPKASFQDFKVMPLFVPVTITANHVENVAKKLRGSAGLGGLDANNLTQLLLRYKDTSEGLRNEVAELTMWLANGFPPWSSYRALMSGRLIALDKNPGVRPIGIGESWRRLFAKCLLAVAGKEAADECGIDNLSGGMSAGIEAAVHSANEVVDGNYDTDDWGFILVDARNAFNELNRYTMLWTVRHLWPSGCRFAFNCYCCWTPLFIRGRAGTLFSLFSKTGVTQGCPISMPLYGLASLPLIGKLNNECTLDRHQWYADDSAAGATFDNLQKYFDLLKVYGPSYGYTPQPHKCVLVTSERNLSSAKSKFERYGMKVVTGTRYLGGFIGSPTLRSDWLREKASFWEKAVKTMARASKKFPQTAYVAMKNSLQMEWQYVHRTVSDAGTFFDGVEEALASEFLPSLFGVDEDITCKYRKLAELPVRHGGLSLSNPTTNSKECYKSSTLYCSHLLSALRGRVQYSPVDNLECQSEVMPVYRSRIEATYKAKFKSEVDQFPQDTQRTLKRANKTGHWLSVMPSHVGGTILSSTEFRDALMLRYARVPSNLPTSCDGCGESKKFDVNHALDCKKGGLVTARHDEIRDELRDLLAHVFSPSRIRCEPMINPAPMRANGTKTHVPCASSSSDSLNADRGDLLVRGFWEKSTDTIIDVRVTNLDSKSYKNLSPKKALERQEKEKKKKYCKPCENQRRHFTPFVVSTDGMFGFEARAFLKRLAKLLAEEWEKPYSIVRGFINARMSIALVRATNRCIRGSRTPASNMSNRFRWEGGAGLGLLKSDN